jgi:hypothetical protein
MPSAACSINSMPPNVSDIFAMPVMASQDENTLITAPTHEKAAAMRLFYWSSWEKPAAVGIFHQDVAHASGVESKMKQVEGISSVQGEEQRARASSHPSLTCPWN